MTLIMWHQRAITIVLIGCWAACAIADTDFADVHGRVLTEPGQSGAAGIVVRIGYYDGTQPSIERETVTDEDGRYNFADIPPASCSIQIATRTMPQASYSFSVTILDVDKQVRDLYLRTPQVVSGVVRNMETDHPIRNARVRFFSPNHHRRGGFSGYTQTDDQGRYRLYLPVAKILVSSHGNPYPYTDFAKTIELDIVPDGKHLVDIDLQTGPRFHGRVFDHHGKPVPNQRISVSGTIDSTVPGNPAGLELFSFFRAERVTDDQGRFEGWIRNYRGAVMGPWAKLRATAVSQDVSNGGCDGASLETTKFADRPFKIVMRPLTLVVVELRTTDGKPINGATFATSTDGNWLETTGRCRNVRYTNKVEALGDGQYRFGGMVPDESYCYMVHAQGVVAGKFRFRAGDALEPVVLATSDRHSVYTLRSVIDPYIIDEPESEWYSPGGFEGDLDPGVVRELPVLLAALREPDVSVQRFALFVLSKMGPAARDAIPVLLEYLDHEHDDIRRGAAAILIRLGDRRALPTIIAEMKRHKQYHIFGFDLLEELDSVPPRPMKGHDVWQRCVW